MFFALTRGYILLYRISKEEDAHFVVVLNSREREGSGNLGNQLAFGLLLRPKVETRGHVDGKHHGQFTFLFEDFDVGISEASRYVPVNVSYIIAHLVLAHLTKCHTPTAECRVVFSCKKLLRQATRLDFHTAHTLQYIALEQL